MLGVAMKQRQTALQRQPHRIDRLDHAVVQFLRDPLSLLQHGKCAQSFRKPLVFETDGYLVGQYLGAREDRRPRKCALWGGRRPKHPDRARTYYQGHERARPRPPQLLPGARVQFRIGREIRDGLAPHALHHRVGLGCLRREAGPDQGTARPICCRLPDDDQSAEDPTALGKSAELVVRGFVDARVQEALQPAVLPEHAHRRIRRTDYLARQIRNALEEDIDIQFRAKIICASTSAPRWRPAVVVMRCALGWQTSLQVATVHDEPMGPVWVYETPERILGK